MMGDIDDDNEKGMIPRLVSDLVDSIDAKKLENRTTTFKLEASYLEIYCERAKDLLTKDGSDLQVRSTPERGVFIEGLTIHKITTVKDVYKLLNQGAKNRAVACTNLNAHSSRSHAIFTMNYTETMFASGGDQKVQTRSKTSRVYLVDLAGSERVKLSGVTGSGLDEAKKINQSLTTLGRIIDMLADRKPNKPCALPVRESMLTWLLGDSLGGNSKTVMLAAVSPSAASYDETLSTLRYAARTKCIINETSINETMDLKLMEELRGQIDDLQVMLKNQSDLANELQTKEEKMAALQKMLEDERLAKERSDQAQKEQAEEERRVLAEKLQLEKEQLEQYLTKERHQLQQQLGEAVAEIQRLHSWARDAEAEKRALNEHFDCAMRESANQSAVEVLQLQERCEAAAKRTMDLDASLAMQSKERSNLQLLVDDLQRKISELQQECVLKEQGWRQERSLLQEKSDHLGRRLQEVEASFQAREMEWRTTTEDRNAQYERELARMQTATQAKISEAAQNHQQAMAAMQRQSDERFQKLKEEFKHQYEEDLQRTQQQHETTVRVAKQQFEDERRRLQQQHEAALQEMSALRAANKRQQAECQWLKQQLEQAHEEAKVSKHQSEEQAEKAKAKHAELLEEVKQQCEEECQKVLHQQGEAVKEAHRKRDAALMEMKKKVAEDMDRMRRVHDEKVTQMKCSHDEALSALQSQVDATWEHQRQEHNKMLLSKDARHAMEIEELECRLADTETRLRATQQEVDLAEANTASYARDLQEKATAAERRHKEEVTGLAQKLTTLHRLLDLELEASRQTEEHLRSNQRRLETIRLTVAKDAQDCRLPQDFKWACLKSPPSAPRPSGSPSSGRGSDLVTPLKMAPNRDSLVSPGLLVRYREPLGDLPSPDIRRLQKVLQADMGSSPSVTRQLVSPKRWEEGEEDALESIGSFNAGDESSEKHPDLKLQITRDESLSLF